MPDPETGRSGVPWLLVLPLALILVLALAYGGWWARGPRPLLIYCAHDAVHAQHIIDGFTAATGIPVVVRYDSEATKSLSLVERLLREGRDGDADLFWNNELLGTLQLAEADLLLPHRGSGWQAMPAGMKEVEGRWCGFAARLRVWVVDPRQLPDADPAALSRLLEEEPQRVAVAKPLYGTTRTHYTVLWQRWGGERLQAWHEAQRAAGRREAAGNADAVRLVEAGSVAACITDIDDAMAALNRGSQVRVLPFRLADGATIAIPNTVGILRCSRQPEQARLLADHLLSAATERALACGDARQLPLGAVDEDGLPEEVRQQAAWARDAVDLSLLQEAAPACLAWLKQRYGP